MIIEKRLQELKLELPTLAPLAGNFVPAKRAGNLLFLSGKGTGKVSGKVGEAFSVEEGYQHARAVGLGLIAVLKQELGDLDRSQGVHQGFGTGELPAQFC